MNIAKQLVDNQARNLVKGIPEYFEGYSDDTHKLSAAFLMIGVASYLNTDIETAYRYLTDGGGDGGFDAAYIDSSSGELNVILFQAKYTIKLEKESAFPENAISKALDVIRFVFDPDAKVSLNERSQAVVDEIHSLVYSGMIPQVTFVCLNNGIKWNNNGQEIIDREFKGQPQVNFDYYNCDDIINSSGKDDVGEVSLQLVGKGLHEDFNYKSVIVGKVSVRDIGDLMKKHGDRLLQRNIRYYLGSSKVNNQIKRTLLDREDNANFFFYNNGITIACDQFMANYLQKENWIVKLKNMQIINGAQTCKTIDIVMQEYDDVSFDNVYVLVRIYQLGNDNSETIRRITTATNSQNAVDLRDLHANDMSQQLLVSSAAELGYTYKPKRDGNARSDSLTIPSSVCAEAVFTVWRQKPFLAKYHKSDLFDKYYDEIFGSDTAILNAAQMVLAVKIFRYCDLERKKYSSVDDANVARRYSGYLMSTLVGQLLLKKGGVKLDGITHMNFDELDADFETNKENYYKEAEDIVVNTLKLYFGYLKIGLKDIDGRTIAAAFRNEEFCGKCIESV